MTPLHRAVIEGDFVKLRNKEFVENWRHVTDKLGFTALEIAKYLGKYQAAALLGYQLPVTFRLQPNGAKMPVELSLNGFEKSLGFHYRPFLTFSSYAFFGEVINQCPYILRSSTIASDNYEWEAKYHHEVVDGKTAPIVIKWIDPVLGYGAFATEDIKKGDFVVEYAGVVRQLSRKHPDQNPYCFHYPTKWWSLKYMTVDSMREGNVSRFINHCLHPNLKPLCLVGRGLLHLVFIAQHMIMKGEQLTFDYGEDYWVKRTQLSP